MHKIIPAAFALLSVAYAVMIFLSTGEEDKEYRWHASQMCVTCFIASVVGKSRR